MNKTEQEFINRGLAWNDDAENCTLITKKYICKIC